jgi:hypothetical protein
MKFVVFLDTLGKKHMWLYLPTLLLGMAVRSLSDLLDHNSKVLLFYLVLIYKFFPTLAIAVIMSIMLS